jgi:hypothetical protein
MARHQSKRNRIWNATDLRALQRVDDLPFEEVRIETNTIASRMVSGIYKDNIALERFIDPDFDPNKIDRDYLRDLGNDFSLLQPDPEGCKPHIAELKMHAMRVQVEFVPIRPGYVIRVRDNAGRRLALEGITDEFGNIEVAGGEEVLKKLVVIAESQQNYVVGKPQEKHRH